MSQAPRPNSIDIPLVPEEFENILTRFSPALAATEFAMRERPESKGNDKRGTWRRFSDWIFDGVLPDSAPQYYGEAGDPEEMRALQEKALLRDRGGKPFVDKDAGDAQRLAADLLVGFADEGELPTHDNPSEEVAGDILLELSRAALSDPTASEQERADATEVIGDRAIRQIIEKQKAEGDLADLSDGNDLAKRVVELWADGKGEEEIGAELRDAGWDYSKADTKLVDRLGQEVEILLDMGELERAKALTFARLNLMKNGGAMDANITAYDELLDKFIQSDAANLTRGDAFSIAGTDAFLSTIRGIGRLTGMGYTTEKDRDILEKMTATAFEEHPVTSFAGSFAGGFVDPVFFGLSMGAAKAPITAASKARYLDDLVARGTPLAIAEKMAAAATLETIATNRLTKYYLSRGLSMRAAQAAGNLTWNITDAAVSNAAAESIVAGGEGASASEIGIRALKGGATGVLMGATLDRAFRGVDKLSRVFTANAPKESLQLIEKGIDYAAAQGADGRELSTQLRQLTERIGQTRTALKRKLTAQEVDQLAQGMGINLEELGTLRAAQIDELKGKKAAPKKETPISREELPELEAELKGGRTDEQAQKLEDQLAARFAEMTDDELDQVARKNRDIDDEWDRAVTERAIARARGEGASGKALEDMTEAELAAEGKRRGVERPLTARDTEGREPGAGDRELEERYGEDLAREEAQLEEIVGDYRMKSPSEIEKLRKVVRETEDLTDERRAALSRAIDQVASERAQASRDFPDRVTADELAEIEAPSADLSDNPDADELADSSAFQRGNIEQLDHRGDDFVKVRVPIDQIEFTRKAIDSEDAVLEYRRMDPTKRPPPALGPPLQGEIDGGKSFIIADGQRRTAAARANGEETIVAYVPEWYATEKGLDKLPDHLRGIGKKEPKVVDRTPEGYGPRSERAPEDMGAKGEQEPIVPELAEEVAEGERLDKKGLGFLDRNGLKLNVEEFGSVERMNRVVGRVLDDIEEDAAKPVELSRFWSKEDLDDELEFYPDAFDDDAFDVVSKAFDEYGVDVYNIIAPNTGGYTEAVSAFTDHWLDRIIGKIRTAAKAHNESIADTLIQLPEGPINLVGIRPAMDVRDAFEETLERFELDADGTKIGKFQIIMQQNPETNRAERMYTFRFRAPKKMAKSPEMGQLKAAMNALGADGPTFDDAGRLYFRPYVDGTVAENIRAAGRIDPTRTPTNGETTPTRSPDAAEPETGARGESPERSGETPDEGRADERAESPRGAGEPSGRVERAPEVPEHLEELESSQEDARYFVDRREYEEKKTKGVSRMVPKEGSKVSGPELRRRRREIEKKIAQAEKIAKQKNPAGRPSKPSKGAAKTLPTFKKASNSTEFLKSVDKIAGHKGGKNKEAFVDLARNGSRATFVEGRFAIRSDIGAWPELARNGWQNDGRYRLEGSNLKADEGAKPRITSDQVDALFNPNAGTVELGEVDLQDLVRDAKRLKILSDGGAAVIARNPDGTIAWSVRSWEGSTTVRAQQGATPIGMFNIDNVEKIARVLQRGGEERITLEVSRIGSNSEPRLTSSNVLAFRGTHNSAILSGLSTKQKSADLPDQFKNPVEGAPKPDTTEMSISGPRRSNPGTERTTPDTITGRTLEDVEGVPGDQMRLSSTERSPQSGADPGITRPEPPAWVNQPAKTRGGKKVLGRIKSDPKGMKYGVRSIAEALTNTLDPLLVRQTREQTRAKNPAHYMERAHLIRTRSASEPNWMFHEQGHAISAIIRESNKRFIKDFDKELNELALWPGSMASKPTAEEGFAEFVRRLIVSPTMMEKWPATARIVSAIESANPKIMDAVRDAARSFDAYMRRPLDARWRSYQNDVKSRPFSPGRVLSRALVDYVSRGFAPELASRRVMVEVRKDAQAIGKGWKDVEKIEGRLKNTAADMVPAYQSLNHIGQMVNIALEGPGHKKGPTGLRVHATMAPDNLRGGFFDRARTMLEDDYSRVMLSDGERAVLREGGFKLPKEPKQHGDIVVLADKSVKDVIDGVERSKWAEFETYAQMKATVARIKTRAMEGESFPYQTQGEGASPIDLVNEIRRVDKENPKWAGVFDELQEIMDATLILDVMSGELTAKDAVSIRNRFEHYIPLTRQGEGGARSIRSGASTAPSANIRRSRGSVNPAEPLLMAMARKIDEAVNAYYWNRFALSPILLGESLRKMDDVPRTAKIAAQRIGVPLMLDTKKVASASADEVRKIIHKYIVDEVMRGNELFNLIPEELDSFTPDDIAVMDGFDLWRRVPPKAVNVIAPNIHGKRHYFQILDDNLYRIFAEGASETNAIARISETLFASATQGLKNQITQSWTFAFRSLFRDPLTAVMFGQDPQAMIPGFYHVVGAMTMLTKREPDSLVSPELLSRVFRQVTPEDFAKQRSKSLELLTEGIVPRGWRDMNALNRGLSAPGIAFRILMKPVELKQVLTGQRWLASAMETAPRLGAYVMAKRRGLSDEAAQLAADTVTGNFSERPLSANAHSIYRTAGFLNPAFQIFGQQVRFLTDPVPARSAARAATIMGNVAFWTSVAWAVNHLASSPEEKKRNAERTERERLTHMDVKGFRIPFDYGILGGIQSYTWNKLDEVSGQRGVSGDQIAKKILGEVLPHTSLNPLEFVPMTAKAGAESSMGYSLYRQSTIEPPYMQYLEPPDRYFDTTPDLYRWIGRAANASPVRVQYFVRNGLGVQVDNMVRALDRAEDGFVYDELASLPEIGGVFSREPVGWNSRSVRDSAQIEREYDALVARAKRLAEGGEADPEAIREIQVVLEKLRPVKEAMLEVQRMYDETKSQTLTDEQRRELKRMMVDRAREGLIQMEAIEQGTGGAP